MLLFLETLLLRFLSEARSGDCSSARRANDPQNIVFSFIPSSPEVPMSGKKGSPEQSGMPLSIKPVLIVLFSTNSYAQLIWTCGGQLSWKVCRFRQSKRFRRR